MSIFEGVNSATDTQKETDRVPGQRQEPLGSNIYNLMIKLAYAQKSKKGALGVNLLLEVLDSEGKPTGRELKVREWVTSGNDKGNKTFYEKQEGDKTVRYDLPGFALINEMATLAVGKGLTALSDEMKTIPLYDYTTKGDKPTDVQMFTELLNKPICGAVLSCIKDKEKANDAGEYVATGQTYTCNEVSKFLAPHGRKTASEAAANMDASYAATFLERWEGNVSDKSTGAATGGTQGAPAAAADGTPAEKPSLFA